MKKKTVFRTTALALASALLLAGCGSSGSTSSGTTEAGTASSGSSTAAASSSDGETVINYALMTAWGDFDPYYTTTDTMFEAVVYDKIYDKLVYTYNAGNDIAPRAADSWESADDGKSIIFHLNENAKWHDGEPVTAEDWVFTVQLLSDPDVQFATRSIAPQLAGTDDNGVETSENSVGAEALDDHTFKLTFKNVTDPSDFLIGSNRYFMVLPEHLLKDVAPADILTADYWSAPIGSGPAKYDSQVIGSELVLDANTDYQLWNGNWDKLVMTVVASSNALTSLISGDIDYIDFGNALSADEKEVAEGAGLTVDQSDYADAFFETIINNQNIDDPDIRLAMHYALNKDALIQVCAKDVGVKAFQSQLPGTEYYDDTLTFDQDIDKAKELLAGSGYDGRTYTIAVGANRETLAAVMQQQWQAIGLNVDILVVDVATMFSGLADGTYDIGFSRHTATANPVWFQGNLSSDSVTDPAYDDYYNQIISETDHDKKVSLVKEYSRYIFDNTPYIPVCHSYSYYAQSPRLTGVTSYPAGGMANEDVWNWNKN